MIIYYHVVVVLVWLNTVVKHVGYKTEKFTLPVLPLTVLVR